MSALAHETVFQNVAKISKFLPFIPALQEIHPDGSFPLVEDPLVTKRATLIGMFVLRPGRSSAFTGPLLNKEGFPESVYNKQLDWVYNVRGLDGGWIIANSNGVDAYRLALQYGASDAVITGSNAVSVEGVAGSHGPGYLWQAYALGEWAQLKSADPCIAKKIQEQREEWQRLGYLSARKYPATIVYTRSGLVFPGSKDFLEARVFSEKHPDGSEVEVLILTSEAGAQQVRLRAAAFGLADRIEDMLVVVPPPAGEMAVGCSASMDLAQVPHILHDRFGMRLVNHDGGQSVLRDFSRAGALAQMNITLCRHQSQLEVLRTRPGVDEALRAEIVASFDSRVMHFFGSSRVAAEGDAVPCRAVPASLPAVYAVSDKKDEVAVLTFDCSGSVDFYSE